MRKLTKMSLTFLVALSAVNTHLAAQAGASIIALNFSDIMILAKTEAIFEFDFGRAIAEPVNRMIERPFSTFKDMAQSNLSNNKHLVREPVYSRLQSVVRDAVPGSFESATTSTLALLSPKGFSDFQNRLSANEHPTSKDLFIASLETLESSPDHIITIAAPFLQKVTAFSLPKIERGSFVFDPQENLYFIPTKVAQGTTLLVGNMSNPKMQQDLLWQAGQLHVHQNLPEDLNDYVIKRLQPYLTQDSINNLNSFLDQATPQGQLGLLKHLRFMGADLVQQENQKDMIPELLTVGVIEQPRENFYQDFKSMINHVSSYIQNNPLADPLRDPARFLSGIKTMTVPPNRSSVDMPVEPPRDIPDFQY